jgi:cell division inhibitor SulA
MTSLAFVSALEDPSRWQLRLPVVTHGASESWVQTNGLPAARVLWLLRELEAEGRL